MRGNLYSIRQTAPGLLRTFGYVNLADRGVRAGSGAVLAAANTLAIETAVQKYGSAKYYLPTGTYPINQNTDINHNTGSVKAITLCGDRGGSALALYGTAGPWLNFATNADSAIDEGGIENLTLLHAEIPTTGADIVLGNLSGTFLMENVKLKNGGDGAAAIAGIQLGSGAFPGGGLKALGCKIELRTDTVALSAGGLNPVGIVVASAHAGTAGGFELYQTSIDGVQGYSYALNFINSGDIDTIRVGPGCNFKDHLVNVRVPNACTGQLTNVFFTDAILDKASVANVVLQPGATGSVGTWNFTGGWWASEAGSTFLIADEGGTGTVSDLTFNGVRMTGATVDGLTFGAGIDLITMTGCKVFASGVNAAGGYGIDVGEAAGAIATASLVGNIVVVGASASASVRISTAVEPFVFVGNTCRGVTYSVPADNGTSKRNSGNAFLA